MLSRILLFLLCAVLCALPASAQGTETPSSRARVAVWEPRFGASDASVPVDPELLNTIAQQLEQAGLSVKRLRVDQLSDPAQFSPQLIDALFMPGEAYPLTATPALRSFVEGGGVLIALDARLPFSKPLVPDVNGKWQVLPRFNPQQPRGDILALFGLETFPYEIQAQEFEVAPTLARYLPGSTGVNQGSAASVVMPRPGPVTGIKVLPLLYAKGTKGVMRPTPLVFFEKRGDGAPRGLISANWNWLFNATAHSGWTSGATLAPALATLAADWKAGRFRLTGEEVLDVDAIRRKRKTSPGNTPR